MTLEHLALNHPDPQAAARWYEAHLGLRVARAYGEPQFVHFLRDDKGTMLELYRNPAHAIPDYARLEPFTFHIALSVDDFEAERARLLEAGASPEGEPWSNAEGDVLAFLRDPWGVCLQLVKRAEPF